MPAQAPKIKYRVPISLWFVEYNHRVIVTGKMAESQVVGCNPNNKGLSPFFTRSWGVITSDCKSEDAGSSRRDFSRFFN